MQPLLVLEMLSELSMAATRSERPTWPIVFAGIPFFFVHKKHAQGRQDER